MFSKVRCCAKTGRFFIYFLSPKQGKKANKMFESTQPIRSWLQPFMPFELIRSVWVRPSGQIGNIHPFRSSLGHFRPLRTIQSHLEAFVSPYIILAHFYHVRSFFNSISAHTVTSDNILDHLGTNWDSSRTFGTTLGPSKSGDLGSGWVASWNRSENHPWHAITDINTTKKNTHYLGTIYCHSDIILATTEVMLITEDAYYIYKGPAMPLIYIYIYSHWYFYMQVAAACHPEQGEERRTQARQHFSQSLHIILGTFGQSTSILW